MNIVRRYKLSKLTNINYLSDLELDIINFVNSEITGLKSFVHPDYEDYIFYMNSDNWIVFIYRKESEILRIRRQGFFLSIMEEFYSFDLYIEKDILELISVMVRKHIEFNISKKYIGLGLNNVELEAITYYINEHR